MIFNLWTRHQEWQFGEFDFVVPFEEDDKDPSIWFLDHNYHESMFHMFKRINGKLRDYIMMKEACF